MKRVQSSKFKVQGYEPKLQSCGFQHALLALIILGILSASVSAEDGSAQVRKPVFAGSFYPADAGRLEKTIDGYLKEAEAKSEKTSSRILGIIAPHAGYEYSGKVAAYAFAQLKGKSYKTVILLGSSHQAAFKGVAAYPSGAWETPLGKVSIDGETAQLLMKGCKAIKPLPQAFEREHSLEVELPFLQKTLKSFRIVPLLTGYVDEKDIRSLADALASIVKQRPRDVVIVVSSDMSHYHPYSTAQDMDGLALKEIEALNVEKLMARLRAGESELCGATGVIALMMVAQRLNTGAKILYYANSGDTAGDKARVVGYGAVLFSFGKDEEKLTTKEQKALLSMARRTLEEYVRKGSTPRLDTKEKNLLEKRGAFVTLTKHGDLRGCIGYIQPVVPLYKAVSEMTIAACSQDRRFLPVAREELKDIHIEISVLSPLRLINNADEIEVGKHGLFISRGNASGLLLPQVATTYMWNREEFLRQTCVKAGLSPDTWKEKGTEIYVFSAQIFSE